MSTDPQPGTPTSRPSQSPPSEGSSQGSAQNRRGDIDHRCAVQDRVSLRVCELAEAQGSRRIVRGDRAAQAGHRYKRHRSRQDSDDAQPGAAQRSTGLWQRRAADVGCRMSRAMGITESCEAGHGGMDDLARIRRAPGGRRTPHASCAERISHPDDGASCVPRRRCERPVARTFPDHLCACESMDPAALKWLLDHGANPNCRDHGYETNGHPYRGTALDYLIAGGTRVLWND
jgi:hypothetical protein